MQREAVIGSRYSDRENSTTDVNAQGLLTTLLQQMGKLEDMLAEARMHMPSPIGSDRWILAGGSQAWRNNSFLYKRWTL